jgi:O-antigen/teichoic acid export membrane protein
MNIKQDHEFDFSRNVLTLMTGTTIAQAIPIAISPILTRLYSPEDFGIFALYIAIVSLLSVFVSGRYELAIMLPQKESDAFHIFIAAILISFSISLILFLIIFFFHSPIIYFLDNPEVSDWLYFIPLSVLLSGLYQSLNYWTNRHTDYKSISKSIVLKSSSNAIFNTSFGFAKFASSGLIITNIISGLLSFLYLFFKNKALFTKRKGPIDWKKLKNVLYEYKQFPLFTMPQNLVYQGTLQLPVFFIQTIFSVSILGFFSLAYRVLATPLSIIGNSLGQVFYQKASSMYREEKDTLYLYIRKMFIRLLLLSLAVGSILTWYLPDIFQFIFGKNWFQAGEIAQYLMIYLIFNFALGPFTKIYLVSGHNLYYLKWELIRICAFLLLFITMYFYGLTDVKDFFILFSLLHLLLYIGITIPILNKNSFLWKQA